MRPPRQPQPRRNLPLLLLQARERVLSQFRPIFNAHGLTDQQWRVLRAIRDAGPLEPRQIGEICCISSPSLAGILARMEQMTLLSRQRLDEDQRRVRVTLTPEGTKLMRVLVPRIEQTYRELEQRLGAEAIEQLMAQLDHVLGALEADRR